jgi:hypothetical protein
LLAVALAGGFAGGLRADTQDLPGVWVANPKLVAKLGLPVHFDEFSLQPPAGLEMTVHHVDQDNTDTYTWRQPGESDRYGAFELTVENTSEPNPTDAIDDWLITLGQNSVDDLNHSDIQTGVIYGNTFARVFYKGPEHAGTRIVHGFVYITIVANRLYALESSDLEPRNATTVSIAEAAAMTLTTAPTESTGDQ